MKIPVMGLDGSKKSEISVDKVLSEPFRDDLITRAVLSERSEKRQPYGTNKLAGKRTSAHYHGRRQKIRHSMMGKEMARMPRIHTTATLYFTARFAPQARKGRAAHPPKVEKVWLEKINKKEWRKALLSAVAASFNEDLVRKRGHVTAGLKNFPIVVDGEIESIKKTKSVKNALEALGMKKELETAKARKRLGPLLVVSSNDGVEKAGRNIAGVEVVSVKGLSVGDFAPGTHAGRLVVWSRPAIEQFEKSI